MKLSELAQQTGATLENADDDLEITGAAGLAEAVAGQVTFLSNPRYTPQVKETRASAIYLAGNAPIDRTDIAVLRAKDPYLAYTKALRIFHPEPKAEPFIHPSAVIDPTAQIAPDAYIGACAVIGANCVIESQVKIYPHVTVYDNVRIGAQSVLHSGVALRANAEVGKRVIIHNNAVIGSDGFGFAKAEDKSWLKIPQTGRVVIEDDVEIGAGTTIDCASVGETRIKRGVKIDNLVQIGHSCTIDEDALICAQVGLAGSSSIGKRVILAGQVGIAGHLHVGDDVVLTAKSATSHDIPPGKIISGIPGFDNKEWLRSVAAFRRLGEMARTIRTLEKRLSEQDRSSKETE
ncbi:MAG TPA: UDP-3-O-(3-hydroxymyristoyl)glucosamine N-acyltransferase [Blastocatellia bacterium]|nr:UDP-3-O-(3-hydroxymyristoyl)glucosamine N-acyltransferase [Blastocatellia bacterium]